MIDILDAKLYKAQEIESHLGYKSSSLSKIIYGAQDLPLDKAYMLCAFFKYSEFEIEYFLNLINIENAGTQSLKDYYMNKRLLIINNILDLSMFEKSKRLTIKRKALKNLDFFNNKGARSVYTMHSEYNEKAKAQIEGIYATLHTHIREITSNNQDQVDKNGYYINIDFLKIT